MARCTLKEANLPKYMWSYAIMSSTYIRNKCYNNRIGTTLYEICMGTCYLWLICLVPQNLMLIKFMFRKKVE